MVSDDASSAASEDDGQERRIILHVYDDESRDFTSLTTYHGMRRIYASATWPSRIFWSLVVVTCLTLFMIHSGLMLLFYHSHPTFIKTLDVHMASKYIPTITFCQASTDSDESHRLAYKILNDVALPAHDLKKLKQISHSDILQDYLNETRVTCEDIIRKVAIGQRILPDPCHYSEEILTDIGYCISVTFRDVSTNPTDSISIDLVANGTRSISFQVHGHRSHSNMKSKRRFLRKQHKSLLSLGISTEHLLHENDWGSCHNEFENLHYDGQLYQQTECEKNCVAMQYIERCSCVPFHLAKPDVKVCSIAEMHFCKETGRPTQSCDCPLECERLLYTLSEPSYVKLKYAERSVLQLELPSHKVMTHYQLKRIKAVDLLSFVAGSMGLFLGMSCVTLLEIFIYLFKSVWGVFNDKRHKTYWGNIIGDDDGNNRRQSYEQIVITTKTAKTEDDQPKAVIEENYAVMTDPMTRRTSVMRIGPPYPISNESRSRSNTGNTPESGPSGALKIRLMRKQSLVTGRRKSLYNAFGNF